MTTETAEPARTDAPPGVVDTPAPTRKDRVRLVLLSFLMLFLELALIRWTGANVVYLSFFTNFVLLGSFLGIGLGFLRANRRFNFFPYAPILLLGLVAFIRFFPVEIRSSGENSNFIYFGEFRESGLPREVVLTVVFLVVAAVMAAIAEGVARTFKRFEPLEAYRLDLVGSVLGIIGISLLSLLRAPSVAWGAAVAVVLLLLAWNEAPQRMLRVLQVGSLVAVVTILAFESFATGVSWSPYYKIKVDSSDNPPRITVNGTPHQANASAIGNPLYNLVYDRLVDNPLDDVLVIGAGGGNDVALALARGAKHVDAVEIDPRLQKIGEEQHPDHPYDSPKVNVVINDGRAFVESTDNRYDLILFALPDSITLLPGQSSVRLESYLFTKEALESAREHLKPGGVFAMYNYYRENWLIDRFAGTLRDVYGHRPCIERVAFGDNFAVLVDAPSSASIACKHTWKASGVVPESSTDDHPFPYLRTRYIPNLYVVTILLILAVSLALVRLIAGKLSGVSSYADLFFMGVAFLLLETKNIVQFALLFGTTWIVNALVFLGILLTVLLAVEVSRRVTFRRPALLYVFLLASLVLAWALPPSTLLPLSAVPRFFAAAAIAFAPVFFANLVFTQRFKDVGSSTTAFAVNLLGAMVGGVLEYLALVSGYGVLLPVVGLAYGAAFFVGRRHLGVGASASTS